ncbi:MAG: VOC family protein [Dehalococcoidia bacterium]|nr:VOC family protein [Dehalococcoidia bacterium]
MTTGDDSPAARSASANPLAVHGKVSYMEIPALDVDRSAAFYADVFGWTTTGGHADEQRRSFEDASGQIIGAWVTGRAISSTPGILPYVYVAAIHGVADAIGRHGGVLARPVYEQGDLWVTEFRDPAGNMLGIWQFR